MNQEWKDWARENLERGCNPNEIKSILQNNGFSNREIQAAMSPKKKSFWGKVSKGLRKKESDEPFAESETVSAIQPGVDYAAMAKPRLLSNADLQVVDVDGIQLYVLEDFMSSAECKAIITEINSNLRPSTITSGKDEKGFRTSSTCDLGYQKSGIVEKIDKKIARTLGIRLSWSEAIQGQKYELGQEFKAHTDYFEPNTKEFAQYAADLGQRTWTFMVYLNETPAGGATHFTAIDKAFFPKVGRAVIWNNLFEDGTPNPKVIHHGMPIEDGEKMIITKWFRDKGKGQPLFP